jgi:threonine/homoserine/homoserine lactone efflux protein
VAAFPLSLVIGVLAGFLGAIPPGPLNVTCLRKALQGGMRDAYRVAAGGAIIDTFVCGLIGLGLGWILEKVVTNVVVRTGLALFLLGYGLKLLLVDLRKDAARSAAVRRMPHLRLVPEGRGDDEGDRPPEGGIRPVLTGLLQGAANPALFVNWTILISFLVGHRLIVPSLATGAGFAIGVGVGVFLWFLVLIQLTARFRDRASGWLGHATAVAGVLLVGFGIFFTWRSFTVK